MPDRYVVIHLTPEEAVVLDTFLRRFSETDQLAILDPTEKQALWNLECCFEKQGDRPNWPDLETARAALRYDEVN